MRRKKTSHSKSKKPSKETTIIKPNLEKMGKRRPWTPKEDEAIQRLVLENGTKQ